MSIRRSFFMILAVTLVFGFPSAAEDRKEESETATEEPEQSESTLGAELLLFEEFPTVVSAARQRTPGHLASVPVSSIDSPTIEASGLQTIAELLQFVPGVDVLEIDRNRFAVGIHGLHDTFAERTLSMIDGFNADSVIFGGSEFQRLPIFLEDIERIEVVRGPGGAAWGANALTGAINIITLDPEESQGGKLRTTYNEFGDLYTYLRWGDRTGAWVWRVSSGFDEWSSSVDALDEGFLSRDFGRRLRANGRAVRQFDSGERLTLGFGYSTYDQGAFEILGLLPERDGRLITYRAFARLERRFGENLDGYAQWLSQYTSSDMPSLQESHSREHHLEMQFNWQGHSRHDVLFGGNVRSARLDTDPKTQLDFFFSGSPVDEWRYGLFASDRFRVSDRWTLETQLRIDEDSETKTDWSGRVSALRSFGAKSQQVLRWAVARAFRAPAIGVRAGTASRFPIGPDLFALRIIAPTSLDNETSWSLETGWALSKAGMQLRIDAYYQQFDDLIGFRRTEIPLQPPVVLTEFQAINLGGADAHGATAEFTVDRKHQHLTAWYSWNAFSTDLPDQVLRSFLPAEHKAGFRYRLDMGGGWGMQALYRYTSETDPDPGTFLGDVVSVPSSHRVDLTGSKGWQSSGIDLLLGIEDLFDETELAIAGSGNLGRHPTPGRTAFARVRLDF